MSPRGFDIERRRGDGYSNKTARECLKKRWRDSDVTPEVHARISREMSIDRWEWAEKKRNEIGLLLTREELFAPYKEGDEVFFDCKVEKGPHGDTGVFVYGGHWLLTLEKRRGRWWDWTLSVKVGAAVGKASRERNYVTGPKFVRGRVVGALGESTWEEFRAMLMAEPEMAGLKEVMNKGMTKLEDLGGKDAVAYSFVTSPSSERLFNRLGIRVEREHAFLFPHYVFE
jgi:hypothetical protein